MSWPLAPFLIVGGVLAIGWLAYERSRLSARMVAVVGTLAAVAALGRDAFVAIPDVKPITAMTLVTGYALGPLAGFTVGALGMLSSNFVLGQGPYTPWQMAAWGLVGLAGAALGALSRRRLGRMQLALCCGFAALFAKELMNVYQWTIGASHSPAALLAVAVTGLPFDLADMVASFLFGVAFAPELSRLLVRMRARMDVSWEPVPTPLQAVQSPPGGRDDGGLRGLGAPGAVVTLLARALALAAPRVPPPLRRLAASSPTCPPRRTPTAVSAAHPGSAAASCTPAGRRWGSPRRGETLPACGAAAIRCWAPCAPKPRASAAWATTSARSSRCAPAARRRTRSPGAASSAKSCDARASDDSFDHQVNLTAFAIFALRAIGHSPRLSAIRQAAGWIERQQNGDGGLRLRRARIAQRCRRHGRGAAGARRRRCARPPRAAPGDGVSDAFAEPRRGLSPAVRQRIQRAVDGLGSAGSARRRPRPRRRASSRQSLADRLPGKPARARRQRALLAHQRADARVGDRAGADRPGRQDLPGRRDEPRREAVLWTDRRGCRARASGEL